MLFFFFQAEDGIRDVAVTGVQTCALPISPHPMAAPAAARAPARRSHAEEHHHDRADRGRQDGDLAPPGQAHAGARSEEHTSELQSRLQLVCRLLLEKKKCITS